MKSSVLSLLLLPAVLLAQAPNAGEAEAQKTEERIAGVQRDVLLRYDDALAELQVTFQKAADLEGALVVRSERDRASKEGTLTEKHLVVEPKALRNLQTLTMAKMRELVAQLVNDTVPRLVEFKKQLTVAGKLDEAVAVRSAIERLQNTFIPASRVEAGELVPAETLVSAYAADRTRADKTYRGQRIVVRGVVGGFRQDAADAKIFLVYLAGNHSTGWVQCAFSTSEFQIREEKQFNNTSLVITSKDKEPVSVRFSKGANAEVRGECEGFDEVVRLAKCDLVR